MKGLYSNQTCNECRNWSTDNGFEEMDVSQNDSAIIANTTFINDLWYVVPTSEILVKTLIFVPIVVWGIFGNVLLIYLIIKNRNLRSPTTLLIANMAAADLITLLVHPWVFLVYDSFQNYQLGKFGCKFEGGFECAILLASVFNLVAISYDRLNAIVLPQEKRMTRRGAKIVMVLAWVIGFVAATPLFIYRRYQERQWLNFLEKFCVENMMVTNIYWHVIITMMVWFPLGVMLVCYIALFIKLNEYEKTIARQPKVVNEINVSYKKKVAKMMCIVVVTFIICRIPFTVLIFYRNQLLKKANIAQTQQVQNQVNGFYYSLWLTSKYLIILNAALNPVIYGLTSEKFRRALKTTKMLKWIDTYTPQTKNSKTKTKQKANNTNSTKRMNIFFIFKSKLQNETVTTDSRSGRSNLATNKKKEITI